MISNTTHVKPPCRVLAFIFLFIVLSTTSYSQVLFSSSFEGTNPFQGATNNQSCCSHSVTASTEHPHDGLKSFRAEVRTDDPAVSSGYRAELTFPNIPDQGDMWYGWSMYFEANNAAGNDWTGCCGHVVQWHPSSSGGGAVLDLRADGGKFDFCVNPAGGGSTTHQSGTLKDIVPGRWYDIVMHVNWENGPNGLLEVWIDGALYLTRQVAWTSGRYFKFGMNRWTMSNTWVVFYDNLKIGRNVTYNDVAPAPATPPANQAPVARAGNDITISLPTVFATLDGSASTDADGTIQSYSWSYVGGPLGSILANPLSALTLVNGLLAGTYTFRLTVTDDDGATSTDDVRVIVNPLIPPPNAPPVANAGNNQTITLPANSVTVNGNGSTDSDGTINLYAWTRVGGPATYTITTPAGQSTTITGLVQGTYTFRLTVTDDDGATSTDDVVITVNAAVPPPNVPPVANAGNNQTITLPANSVTVNGNGSTDSDGTIDQYAWTRVGGPVTYTITTPAGQSTTITGLVQGIYTFRLTVTDDDGATSTDDVVITVNAAVPPANNPPIANAGNNQTITLPTNSVTVSGSASTDADGTVDQYSWIRAAGPLTYTITTPAGQSTTITGLVQGSYTFRLTVTDNDGATSIDDVVITVNAPVPPPNVPPVANAGNNQTITLPTNSVTLNSTGSTDADGTIQAYNWAYVNGPATYSITNAAGQSTTVTGLVQGTYTFRLTVRDDDNATATDDVTVTVNPAPAPPPNTPPVPKAGTDIVITLPTNQVTVNGNTSTDADGTIQAYNWAYVSGPATFSITNANSVATTITGLVQGVYIFRLTVRDDDNATAADDIRVTVNPAPVPPPPVSGNQGPIANAGNDATIEMPVSTTTLYGTGSTDPDGLIVSYEWTQLSGPTQVVIVNNRLANIPLNDLMIGEYVFQLKVTDNFGASATATVRIIVRNKNGEEVFCNVYPNPTRDNLKIQYASGNTGKVRIMLYDANNRFVLGETVQKSQALLTKTIDISRYRSGTYFLELTIGGSRKIVRKVIKL